MVDEVAMRQYFYGYFRFPLSVTFYQFSVLISIHMMLLPDGQMGEARESSNKQCCFGNRREFDRKVILLICVVIFFISFRFTLHFTSSVA